MRVRGLSDLPKPEFVGQALAFLRQADPERLRIVIPLEAQVGPAFSGLRRAHGRRKLMRRVLHEAAREGAGPFDLVGSRKRHPRLPAVARSREGSVSASRSLYLEALGIAIMPDLSPREVVALEEAGALVLDNERVLVDDPKKVDVVGSVSSSPSHLDAIGISWARERGLTGKGVMIGILDTGIDMRHPEFAGKTVHFASFKAGGQRGPSRPRDYGNHGTHVAALAAGRSVGVAPDSDLAVAAVLTERRDDGSMIGYRTQILQGLNWLAGVSDLPRSVDVLNASLGSSTNPLPYHGAVFARRTAGLLTVASIGNSGAQGMGNHTTPGKLDCALAVGAIDDAGQVADFSDWGQCFADPDPSAEFKPDIMAPGVEVESAVPRGRYARKSGTSMASPLVSGACALLIEQNEDLRGDPARLMEALFEHCAPLPKQPIGYDMRRGGRGRLTFGAKEV